MWQDIAAYVAREVSTENIKSILEALTLESSSFVPLKASVPSSQGEIVPCIFTLARTAHNSASQALQDLIDSDFSNQGRQYSLCDQYVAGHIEGVGGTKIDSLSLAERRVDTRMLVVVRMWE